MKYRQIQVNGHKILEISIEKDPELLERANIIATKKSEFIHNADAAGQNRTEDEIFSQNFLGALADLACAALFQRYFEKHEIPISVIRYDDIRKDNFKDPDFFDIKLSHDGVDYFIEVRSSVCIFLSLQDMINRWQILGSYTSDIKGNSEEPKSFYIRPLFHLNSYLENRKNNFYDRASGYKLVKSGDMSLYIVGGTTHEVLQELGRNEHGEELKQGNSEFKVIDILDGYDVEEFLSSVAQIVTNNSTNT